MTKKLTIRSSSLPRLALCPGSLAACEGIRSPDTVYSLEGTQCHIAMEAHYKGIPFDEMRLSDSGSMRTSWFKREADQLIAANGGAKKVFTELELSSVLPCGVDLTGHLDLAVHCGNGRIIIIDWKFGHLEVTPAPKNKQLMGYVYLFAKSGLVEDIQEIDSYIFSSGNEQAFTGSVITADFIPKIESYIDSIVVASLAEDAPRNPNEEACRYCQVSGTDRCQESIKQMDSITTEILSVNEKSASLPARKEEVVRIFKAIKEVESFSRKFFSLLKQEIKDAPDAWDGLFELNPGNTVRSIADVQAVFEKVVEGSALVSPKAFLESVELRIGSLEKLLKEPLKESGVKVKDQKNYVSELLGDLLEEKQNAPSIKLVAE